MEVSSFMVIGLRNNLWDERTTDVLSACNLRLLPGSEVLL